MRKTTKRRATAKTYDVNSFRAGKFCDHTILDSDDRVVGHVRVKPSGILWKRADGKRWIGVSLDKFSNWMEEPHNGKKQTK